MAGRLGRPREDADFRDWVTGLGLGGFTEALRGARVESVELPTAVGGTGPVQLGGVPDLPPGVSWPATPAGPLVLLAQVDLTAAYLDSTGLPAEGTLQVFAGPETGDVRLLVHPPDVPLAPAVVPDGCHVLPTARSRHGSAGRPGVRAGHIGGARAPVGGCCCSSTRTATTRTGCSVTAGSST